jgi:hypothetical protein
MAAALVDGRGSDTLYWSDISDPDDAGLRSADWQVFTSHPLVPGLVGSDADISVEPAARNCRDHITGRAGIGNGDHVQPAIDR